VIGMGPARRALNFLPAIAALTCLPAFCRADVIMLTNGQTLEGVITHEAGSQVRVQIAWTGYVTLTRDAIVQITRHEYAKNHAMLARWKEEHLASLERDAERQDEEQAPRKERWIRFEGQWLRPEELAMIQDSRAQKEQDRQEETRRKNEIESLTNRIEALEEENQRLREDLGNAQNRVVVVQPGFLHFPGSLFPGRSRRFKDEQGNEVRVQFRRGESFFTKPDGQRVEVNRHGDHFSYMDQTGHHDLTPAHP
jgi:hypothetical protein